VLRIAKLIGINLPTLSATSICRSFDTKKRCSPLMFKKFATIVKLCLVLIVIIITFIAIIGCSDNAAEFSGPEVEEATIPANGVPPVLTAEEIINRHTIAQEAVTTWRSQVTMTMDIAVSSLKNDSLSMSLDTDGAVDLPRKKLEMDSSISIGLRGKNTSYKTSIYLVDNVLYTSDEESQVNGFQWGKKSLSGDEIATIWGKQLDMLSASRYLEIFAASESVAPQLVQKNGISCYLIEMTPDLEVFNERIQELISHGGSSTEVLPFDTQDIFDNAKISFWIDVETYNMIGYEMTTELALVDNGSTLEGYIENTGRFYDFDAELSIEAPD